MEMLRPVGKCPNEIDKGIGIAEMKISQGLIFHFHFTVVNSQFHV